MALEQKLGRLQIKTHGKGFVGINSQLARWLAEMGAQDGLLTIFIRHSSASLIIQENADPSVLQDLGEKLESLAPASHPYRHASEGPDDMPAHIKCMLTPTSLTIPVMDGRMELGTWQGVFVAEHRARPHKRELSLHFLGSLQA